jgi:MFS family permease
MESSLLHHTAFVRYWISQITSAFGLQMLNLALAWHLYELTNSAFDLGLVGLAQFVPAFALTLVAGQVADRYDRRLILIITNVVYCGVALVLVAGAHGNWLTRDIMLGCAFALGSMRAFESPTMSALLPQLVHGKLLPRATASSSACRQTATVAGPALGGVIYLLGPATVFGASALFYFIATLLIYTLRVPPVTRLREPVTWKSVLGGVVYTWQKPVLFGAISLDLFAVLLGGATALLPIYAKDILETGPWGLGLLRSAPAIGALITAAWLVRHPFQRGVGTALFASVIAFGLFTIGFGLSTWFPLSMLMLALMGGADMVSQVIRLTMVQLETPDDMRGRVSAVNSIFISTSNQLGQFRSGLTAEWWGAVASVLVGGIGSIVIAALWMKMFPDLRNRQVLEAAPHKD